MKREGIFMVGDHLVGERANSGESERSTASSLASISYRSPRPAAPPAKMPAFARLLGYIANMRSEEHTSELQSLMRNSYAVFCLQKKKKRTKEDKHTQQAK